MIRQFSKLLTVAGLILLTGNYLITPAEAAEEGKKTEAVKAAPAATPTEAAQAVEGAKPAEAAKKGKTTEPSLGLKAGGKNTAKLELQSDIPVRALQFSVTGAKITEVRTTGRAKGFFSKFNEQNGMVIILSTTGEEIAPGKGEVAEIVCDKPATAKLADVKIVGKRSDGSCLMVITIMAKGMTGGLFHSRQERKQEMRIACISCFAVFKTLR